MKFYKKSYLPLFLGIACAFGIFLGAKLNFSNGSESLFASNPKKEKLNRLIDYIDYEYVDQVNTDSIVDVTVDGILENLDPHSTYIPQSEYKAVAENMKGDFVGIGVSFYTIRDTISVINTIEDGPSEKSGIVGGDRILYADNIKLFGNNVTNDSLSNFLKGKRNTNVTLTVYRPSEDKTFKTTIKRGDVPLKSVDAFYMLTDELGYIKMNRFAESTYTEFKQALTTLQQQGATELAIDLRGNPGGYIGQTTKIIDEFLEDDKLILFTKNKKGKVENTYATRSGNFEDGGIYVLIDETSASASEIIAGAIQDNDRGLIIGRRSYGKGLVQREMALGDGSAVRLTIARYYTPTGRSIQKPYENGNDAYFSDYLNRYKNGELISQDSITVADSLKFRTPKGKIVYGGGGIIPDIFIPKDTSYESESIRFLLRSGFMNRFVFNLLEKNRDFYTSLSFNEFVEKELITNATAQEFINYTANQGYRLQVKNHLPDLKRYLKATMAQQLYGSNAFEKLVNEDDAFIKKVIKISTEDASRFLD